MTKDFSTLSSRERVNPAQQEVSGPSVISSSLLIQGNLITRGVVHIDGTIEGDVQAANIVVGEKGSVTGNVIADTIDVHGFVHGNITSRIVELKATAHVIGETTHEVIAIENGACLDGKFTRTS